MSRRVTWNGAPAKYAGRTTRQTRRSGLALVPEKLQGRERRWSKTQAGNRNIKGKTARFERNQRGRERRSWTVNAYNWPIGRPGDGKRPTKSWTSNRENLTWERTKMGQFPDRRAATTEERRGAWSDAEPSNTTSTHAV
jgi:hypothetical protein